MAAGRAWHKKGRASEWRPERPPQAEGLPHKTGRLSVEVPPLLLRDLLEERRKHWEGAVGR